MKGGGVQETQQAGFSPCHGSSALLARAKPHRMLLKAISISTDQPMSRLTGAGRILM
jgi:hypothetical protein